MRLVNNKEENTFERFGREQFREHSGDESRNFQRALRERSLQPPESLLKSLLVLLANVRPSRTLEL